MVTTPGTDEHFAQVCVNGDVITETTKYGATHAFCPTCGARTIGRCESCEALIPGGSPMALGDWSPPAYCGSCGRPYPWTESARQAANEMIDLLEGLTPAEREQLKGTLDDLAHDSARTEVAAHRFKLLARKVGSEGATALRAIVTGLATEAAKRAILGP